MKKDEEVVPGLQAKYKACVSVRELVSAGNGSHFALKKV